MLFFRGPIPWVGILAGVDLNLNYECPFTNCVVRVRTNVLFWSGEGCQQEEPPGNYEKKERSIALLGLIGDEDLF